MSHPPNPSYGALTDVPGVLVGHWTDPQNATGCTVVLVPKGAVGGVEVRGSAPGTRETDLLRPTALVQQVHAVVLSGGSAFGLATADGVMRWLEERGIGFRLGTAVVPIVPAAILFDLLLAGPHKARPGPEAGYQACQGATAGPVAEGSVGAGTGATVGKILGMARATKGGIGTASLHLGQGIVVAALVAVNAVGDVVDPHTGRILAGPRREDGKGFHSTVELLLQGVVPPRSPQTNTTIGIVATNARLTKEQVNKLAVYAQDGLALAIRPCHTMRDGDCMFALATGEATASIDLDRLGVGAVQVVAEAVVRAVLKATPLAGIPAAREVLPDLPQV
ncbi:MAG: P1 family peptidase [Dehalococcoidia bacterium]|nr:P1 family peptidase [Dehalococcoidia bacterium]MDW8119994.1 P1 family peptidase [Chloroflexota bacterium]